MTKDSEEFLDAWNELNGGVSSLLGNDKVMNALAEISLDEGVTAANVLTGVALNVADMSALLDKEIRGDRGNLPLAR